MDAPIILSSVHNSYHNLFSFCSRVNESTHIQISSDLFLTVFSINSFCTTWSYGLMILWKHSEIPLQVANLSVSQRTFVNCRSNWGDTNRSQLKRVYFFDTCIQIWEKARVGSNAILWVGGQVADGWMEGQREGILVVAYSESLLRRFSSFQFNAIQFNLFHCFSWMQVCSKQGRK